MNAIIGVSIYLILSLAIAIGVYAVFQKRRPEPPIHPGPEFRDAPNAIELPI
jgi:hypothetical protein